MFFTDVPDKPLSSHYLVCGICKGTGLIPKRWWYPWGLVLCPMCGGDGRAKLEPVQSTPRARRVPR